MGGGKLLVVMYGVLTVMFLGLAVFMDDRHQSAIDNKSASNVNAIPTTDLKEVIEP